MNVKMNNLMLVCALLGSTGAAVAAPSFSDRDEVTKTLVFERKANELTLSITQYTAGDAGYGGAQVPAGTKVATLSVQGEREARLAYRWKNDPNLQTVQGDVATVKMVGEGATDTIDLKLETAGTDAILDTTDNQEYYVTATSQAALERDITLARQQDIAIGTYEIAVEAAVYNQ